jgi:hypothetical protein
MLPHGDPCAGHRDRCTLALAEQGDVAGCRLRGLRRDELAVQSWRGSRDRSSRSWTGGFAPSGGRPHPVVGSPKFDHALWRRADRDGWICDGPLCGGGTKNRTFVCWLDLAEERTGCAGTVTSQLRCRGARSSKSITTEGPRLRRGGRQTAERRRPPGRRTCIVLHPDPTISHDQRRTAPITSRGGDAAPWCSANCADCST